VSTRNSADDAAAETATRQEHEKADVFSLVSDVSGT
jgi:hypothetical protein